MSISPKITISPQFSKEFQFFFQNQPYHFFAELYLEKLNGYFYFYLSLCIYRSKVTSRKQLKL